MVAAQEPNQTHTNVVVARDNMILPLDWVKKNIDDENQTYYFDFRYNNNNNYSAFESSQLTIKYIIDNYPPPYRLFLSGGVDSQAMLYAWHKSGIEYETYSAVYNYNLNEHDLVALKNFASLHKISVNFVDFDLIGFLRDEHDFYARTYLTGSPQFTCFMKMVSLQEHGTSIMSGNFLQLHEIDYMKDKKYTNYPCKNGIGLYHYARKAKNNFIPFFFLEQPYLAYAFTLTDYVEQFIRSYGNFEPDHATLDLQLARLTPYLLKCAFYQSHGFPVLRQYKKLNGFEEVKKFYDDNYEVPANVHKLEKLSTQHSTRVFDLLYRNKYEVNIARTKYLTAGGLK